MEAHDDFVPFLTTTSAPSGTLNISRTAARSPTIGFARHAISIDEDRLRFPHEYWGDPRSFDAVTGRGYSCPLCWRAHSQGRTGAIAQGTIW
jgi:hypothetical protein